MLLSTNLSQMLKYSKPRGLLTHSIQLALFYQHAFALIDTFQKDLMPIENAGSFPCIRDVFWREYLCVFRSGKQIWFNDVVVVVIEMEPVQRYFQVPEVGQVCEIVVAVCNLIWSEDC